MERMENEKVNVTASYLYCTDYFFYKPFYILHKMLLHTFLMHKCIYLSCLL